MERHREGPQTKVRVPGHSPKLRKQSIYLNTKLSPPPPRSSTKLDSFLPPLHTQLLPHLPRPAGCPDQQASKSSNPEIGAISSESPPFYTLTPKSCQFCTTVNECSTTSGSDLTIYQPHCQETLLLGLQAPCPVPPTHLPHSHLHLEAPRHGQRETLQGMGSVLLPQPYLLLLPPLSLLASQWMS